MSHGGEAKKSPPCYGISVAPAATLTDPGLTRADTGAGRVWHSTTRRLPAVCGHDTIPAGAVWQPLCTSAAPAIGVAGCWWEVFCLIHQAWEAAYCMPICIKYLPIAIVMAGFLATTGTSIPLTAATAAKEG